MTSQAQSAATGQTHTSSLTIGIIGLGEADRIYGTALHQAGHDVYGYDPFNSGPLEGVTLVDSIAAAVAEANVVLVLTAAAASHTVAEEAMNHLAADATWADLTSSAPSAKQHLAARFSLARPDVKMADIAILGPVISLGTRTPLMAAGAGAPLFRDLVAPFGCSLTLVEGEPGSAMAHKLLRSVFMKGLAAAITEAVTAGRAIGSEDWIRGQIVRELSGDGNATIERLMSGSVTHAARRSEELTAAASFLSDMGVDNTIAAAVAEHLRRLQK